MAHPRSVPMAGEPAAPRLTRLRTVIAPAKGRTVRDLTSARVAASAADGPRRSDLGLALVALVGLTVLAGRTDLWGDEGFTAAMVRLGWGQLLADLRHIDTNMTVHYLVLRAWTTIAGHSEIALRLPSIVAALAGGLLAVNLIRRHLGERVAAVARVAILLNPFVWLIALTVRPYGFVMLVSALLTVRLVRALEESSARNWAIWAAVAVVLLYVHLLGIFVIAAHIGVALVLRRRVDRPMLVAGLAVAVGAIPSALFAVRKNTLDWIPKPTLRDLSQLAVRIAGGHWTGRLMLVAAAIGVVALVRRWRERPIVSLTLLAWLVLPIAAMFAMLPLQSLFIDEYFAIVLIPLLAIAAVGAERVAGRVAPITMALVCAVGLVTVARTPTLAQQNWRDALSLLDRQVQPSDTVAFPNAFYRVTAEEYGRSTSGQSHWFLARPALPTTPWGSLRPYELDRIKRLKLEQAPEMIRAELAGAARIWFVGPRDNELNQASSVLRDLGYSEQDQTVPGLVIERFDAPR